MPGQDIIPQIMKALRHNGQQALEDKRKRENKGKRNDEEEEEENGIDASQAVAKDVSADIDDADGAEENDEEEKEEEDYNI
jgi:hypothetical protein